MIIAYISVCQFHQLPFQFWYEALRNFNRQWVRRARVECLVICRLDINLFFRVLAHRTPVICIASLYSFGICLYSPYYLLSVLPEREFVEECLGNSQGRGSTIGTAVRDSTNALFILGLILQKPENLNPQIHKTSLFRHPLRYHSNQKLFRLLKYAITIVYCFHELHSFNIFFTKIMTKLTIKRSRWYGSQHIARAFNYDTIVFRLKLKESMTVNFLESSNNLRTVRYFNFL